jgi:hypothetical protein
LPAVGRNRKPDRASSCHSLNPERLFASRLSGRSASIDRSPSRDQLVTKAGVASLSDASTPDLSPPLGRHRNAEEIQQSGGRISKIRDEILLEQPQAVAAFGRSSRGISCGSTKSWIERAFPGVRLISPFSASVASMRWIAGGGVPKKRCRSVSELPGGRFGRVRTCGPGNRSISVLGLVSRKAATGPRPTPAIARRRYRSDRARSATLPAWAGRRRCDRPRAGA